MKIRSSDYKIVLDYLISSREQGQEFVAFFDSDFPVNKEGLFTFSNQREAQKFCDEMSTDAGAYSYLAIRSAYRSMSEARKETSLLLENDGIVDVGLMVFKYYERFQIEEFNNNQNIKIMNERNFEYLRDQVKYTGFGEGLENELKQKLQEGNPEFKLSHETKYGNDTVKASLNFTQSKQSDMYFFNSYQVNVQKENNHEPMTQVFYINKGNNITLKEAYNLLEGRSVNKNLSSKDGQVYNAWIQMNFKQSDDNGSFKLKHYHQNYGYDLEAILSKHPIRELSNDGHKSILIESLKKGNLQSVTFQINGAERKQFIEANPQFKTINIYDSNLKRIDNRQSKKESRSEGENQSVKHDNKKEKQSPAEDDGPEVPKKSNKRRTQRVSQ